MRAARQLLGVLWLVLAGAAAGQELPVSKIVETVATGKDPDQTYALYLPTGYGQQDRRWPVLFVLDPRGRAIPGIERFLPAAERHGYIVLSSYTSQSDTSADVNVRALDALLQEAQTRYRFHPRRLYLAGMSGTAHAAWRFAQILEENVAGVIAAVGGVQESTQGPPGPATFAYYGITGTADFNYQEMLRLEEHMLASGIDHRLEIFEGRHGWPPHDYTNRALDWMELQAVKRGLAEPDPELVEAELERARQAAAAAEDPLERLRRYRDVVRDFPDSPGVDADQATIRQLEKDPEVKARRKQERALARSESSHTTRWYVPWLIQLQSEEQRLPTVAESLIALRVGPLKEQAANPGDPPAARSAERTLEYLYVGVASSHPRDFQADGELDRAIRSLEVAVAIFPERAGGYWRLASALVRAGREEAAVRALRKAIGFGNVDLERFKNDPDWEPLRDRVEWSELLILAEKRARR